MNTFTLDPEVTRSLARDLDQQSLPQPLALPSLPGGCLSDFCSALTAAFHNVAARDEMMRSDLAHLAEVAVVTTHAALTVDSDGAAAFANENVPPRPGTEG
ncbi:MULTISPECIES: transducer protein Htr23 [unclassified Corynebacterium]|uniref:transducer protein Htr23 n=1 Tax=unclassified Corynebacterium TaxID=2624378 RepID=UPI000ADF5E9F|nr:MULTISPECIES: transducer protein Htr23 [unclassified Corynebacterium]